MNRKIERRKDLLGEGSPQETLTESFERAELKLQVGIEEKLAEWRGKVCVGLFVNDLKQDKLNKTIERLEQDKTKKIREEILLSQRVRALKNQTKGLKEELESLQIKIEEEGLNEFLGYNESFKIDIDETLKTEQQTTPESETWKEGYKKLFRSDDKIIGKLIEMETEDINRLLKLESNHDILEKYICNLKKNIKLFKNILENAADCGEHSSSKWIDGIIAEEKYNDPRTAGEEEVDYMALKDSTLTMLENKENMKSQETDYPGRDDEIIWLKEK